MLTYDLETDIRFQQGFKKGFQQGFKKGFQQSIEKGVIALLTLDIPIATITKTFEITEKKVLEIKEKIKKQSSLSN